jgi:uncharacterized protein (DUF1330 family)
MNSKVKRNILVSLLLFVLSAAAIGYYLFTKGPVDVRESSALKINAVELYEQFSSDSTAALKNYTGKVLQVTGEVNSVSHNQKKEKVILLKTNTGGAFINCTMEQDPGIISINTHVNIKGICSGIGQGDEDLGIKADVYLTRCVLIK